MILMITIPMFITLAEQCSSQTAIPLDIGDTVLIILVPRYTSIILQLKTVLFQYMFARHRHFYIEYQA